MNEPSEEQQIIINNIIHGNNVIVEAVAGSGKSTTILSAAKQLCERQIIQVTYNSMLRCEIREKISELELSNIQVHTFHSLAVKYYLPTAHTDTGIRYILYNNIQPSVTLPKIDLFFIDEAQDMSELYYKFIFKFIKDLNCPIQLLILGDRRQCLYDFKGADPRFLTMADQIWSKCPYLSSPNFVKCTLQMSYRITQPMADFVNKAMLGEELMLACRDGEPVTYIKNSRYNIEKVVIYQIGQLLEKGVKPNEIFVLGASVKGANSNVRKMENALVEQNIPCHVPMFEHDKIDERVIDGKIVFSTFHCVKGRQRKYVFIVGFDQNYFNHFARTIETDVCPNTLYVACTRATHGLYLLEFDQRPTDRPLEFLKMNHSDFTKSNFVKFKGTPRSLFYTDERELDKTKSLIDKKYETPTKLIKFIPDYTMDEISPIIDRIFIKESDSLLEIDIPTIIQTERGFFEDVSDLNGIAIPAIYYDILCKNNSNILSKMIENSLLEMKENEHLYLKNIVKELPTECVSIDDYLFLANVHIAIQERLYFKLKQIGRNEYNWVSNEIIQQCRERLDANIGVECDTILPESEQIIIHHSMEDEHAKIDQALLPFFDENVRFRFSAIVDIVTEKSVWELKCTTQITIDHMLQVIIYAWLWKILDKPERMFRIFNVKTGEKWVLQSNMDELLQIIVALLKGKYGKNSVKTDEEFLSSL
jgi:hypothetical protein